MSYSCLPVTRRRSLNLGRGLDDSVPFLVMFPGRKRSRVIQVSPDPEPMLQGLGA